MKKFYKIVCDDNRVLCNQYDKICESLFGYGGVLSKDNRKAKRFATIQEAENEIKKITWYGIFTIMCSDGRWQKVITKQRR